ncbi:hypothetical protein K3G63_22020 [Hymenobacter sp. HSC-4F20]|uniref:hypothetical protein n=1 Tax=Hymenobacter sp. HSC-4F20 TaxID=2864135 RepID=UPI001C73876B|nr:hypothetical protein [Hymenobacter sp. HSC-4F20]MBX0293138.1 hypothetical protein [Hymenobacter sp. HSC-4F20]
MSFRRIMGARLGEDLPVYRVEPGGEFVPLSLADQIESEINEDLANARLVEAFNSVLLLGAEALQLYQTLDPTQKNSYYHLQSLLTWMLDYKVTLATGA